MNTKYQRLLNTKKIDVGLVERQNKDLLLTISKLEN